MIGRISGTLVEKNPPQVLVEVQGVGYELEVPMSTLYNLPATGERVSLYTHLVVREDAHLLYGFGSDAERRAFRELLRVGGIGARTALAVLSGLSVEDLVEAVTLQQTARLVKVPGIGKKTAERLLFELKGRLGAEFGPGIGARDRHEPASDVVHALLALGYSDKEAAQAVKGLPESLSVSDGIRHALKLLARA